MKSTDQLPTLHEIVQQQDSMPSEPAIVPVAAATSPVLDTDQQGPVQEHLNAKTRHERVTASIHTEFATSTNQVIKTAWQNALLQYLTNKLNTI